MSSLYDLDEALTSVRSSVPLEYMKEALASYKAGAYKSSVSMVWVAICSDIIEKIRELYEGGDHSVKAIYDEIKNIDQNDIPAMLNCEKKLLQEAENIGLITAHEKTLLGRVQEDRHRTVHPSFVEHTPVIQIYSEQARSHIINSIIIILSMPPVQGKALLSKIEEVIKRDTFPVDLIEAESVLKSPYILGAAKDSLFRNSVILITKKAMNPDSSFDNDTIDRFCSALHGCMRISEDKFKAILKEKINSIISNRSEDHSLHGVFSIISVIPWVWGIVDEPSKSMIKSELGRQNFEEFVLNDIDTVMDVDADFKDIIFRKIDELDDSVKFEFFKAHPSKLMIRRVTDLYGASTSYVFAEARGYKNILPIIKYFSGNDLKYLLQKVLLNYPGRNQIIGANLTQDILIDIFDRTKGVVDHTDIWNEFIQGLSKIPAILPRFNLHLKQEGFIQP